MASGVEMTIMPGTGRFDPGDQRWLDQVATLVTALREDVGAVLQRRIPEPDTKGAVSEVVLALGSAGALTAAMECFRAWLRRDKTRSLEVVVTADSAATQTVRVTGENIDQASFQVLVEAIGKALGR